MFIRIFSILLLGLYLSLSIGISGSFHFCGGSLAAVVIIPTDEHPCACGDSEPMNGGCCDDSEFSYKITDAHKHLQKTLLNTKRLVANIDLSKSIELYIPNEISVDLDPIRIREKEPPDVVKRYILFESYLI